jgi:hypothetical protein
MKSSISWGLTSTALKCSLQVMERVLLGKIVMADSFWFLKMLSKKQGIILVVIPLQ